MRRLKNFDKFDNSDCTVFLCSFAAPHGIKLCGNNLISDISYPDDTILSNVTHELFHPPYDLNAVRESVLALAEKPWVAEAFANQNPNSGYVSMEGFIEENIVEALGVYVVVQLGVKMDPFAYFKVHDGGSHVLSPYFYRYLCEHQKDSAEPFEAYFNRFAASLEM
ncbi:MAG: hypothetical protein FWC62_09970 [Firmicutes bacterium]|nr:hypothetical protein [Bacillota bacterium]